MKIKKKLIRKVLSVLIRNVGDARECPHCKKAFTPNDIQAKNSLEAYELLAAEFKKKNA